MRTLISIFTFLMVAMTSSAQLPEGDVVPIGGDSAAMSILESYRHLLPPNQFDRGSWRIRTWHPQRGVRFLPLPDADNLLWMESDMMPRVKVAVPKFVDYNSVTLRFGGSTTTITISNGSAYNNMPWPNSPIGYRDARTLSFPVPR